MFEGSQTLSLDNKGRLSMPTKYRDALTPLVVVPNPYPDEPCLLIYPAHVWDRVKSSVSAKPNSPAKRQLMRKFIGAAEPLNMDNNGRLLIKSSFREWANLDKKTILVGQDTKLELWDEDTWNALYGDDNDEEYLEMLESISI